MRTTKTWTHEVSATLERPVSQHALDELVAFYTSLPPRSSIYPWTRNHAIVLGALFRKAWGVLPPPKRMRPEYAMPPAHTIITLFTSYQAYYDAVDLYVATAATHKPDDRKPDRAAMETLQRAYAALPMRSPKMPWTASQAVTLGVLFMEAWHFLPTPGRLHATYCLPDIRTICRLFGSLAGFHTAIAAASASQSGA